MHPSYDVRARQRALRPAWQGVRLGQLERSEEEIGVYEQVVARFGDDPAPALLHLGMASTDLTATQPAQVATAGPDEVADAGPLIQRPVELVELSELVYHGIFSAGLLVASIATGYAIVLAALQPAGHRVVSIVVCALLLAAELIALLDSTPPVGAGWDGATCHSPSLGSGASRLDSPSADPHGASVWALHQAGFS